MKLVQFISSTLLAAAATTGMLILVARPLIEAIHRWSHSSKKANQPAYRVPASASH